MLLEFLPNWNCTNLFYDNHLTTAASISFYTDASLLYGFGCFFGKFFFVFLVTNSFMANGWMSCPTLKTMLCQWLLKSFTQLLSLLCYGVSNGQVKDTFPMWQYCNVNIIKKGRSKEPFIMKLMHRLTMCAAINNFSVFSEQLPGARYRGISNSITFFKRDSLDQLID